MATLLVMLVGTVLSLVAFQCWQLASMMYEIVVQRERHWYYSSLTNYIAQVGIAKMMDGTIHSNEKESTFFNLSPLLSEPLVQERLQALCAKTSSWRAGVHVKKLHTHKNMFYLRGELRADTNIIKTCSYVLKKHGKKFEIIPISGKGG